MPHGLRLLGRRTGVLALVGLIPAAAAIAAAPTKGGSYSGTLAAPRSAITVTFKVSANGKRVSGLKISDVPIFCSGGGQPVPIKFKRAKVSRGRFSSTGKQVYTAGPLKGKVGAKLSITGKFAHGGKESGKLKIKFAMAPTCDGTTKYATHT